MDEDSFLADLKNTFIDEFDDILENLETQLLAFETDPDNSETLSAIFRYFHNIKGSSKTVGLQGLSGFAHSAENMLSKLRTGEFKINDAIVDCLLSCIDLMAEYGTSVREGSENTSILQAKTEQIDALIASGGSAGAPDDKQGDDLQATSQTSAVIEPTENPGFALFDDEPEPVSAPVSQPQPKAQTPTKKQSEPAKGPEETIKIPISKINTILDLFGEQVILQSGLDHEMNSEKPDPDYISKAVSQLKKNTQDLQNTMVTLRMVSLKNLFGRLERAIRDVAKITNKKVQVIKKGDASELDKTIVDELIDPLNHIVRNCVDHGIEAKDERQASGKNLVGTITISAHRSGGAFEILIQDDGKGLNLEKLQEKGVSKGLLKAGAPVNKKQIMEVIFSSGFSTLEKVTEISGRGVGMDVVRQHIKKLKGSCEIDTEPKKGTQFKIRVPLSLAMFNGTTVAIFNQRYVVPNSDFSEAVNFNTSDLCDSSSGTRVLHLGDRVLRVIDLENQLQCHRKNRTGISTSQPLSKKTAVIASYDNQLYALVVHEILSQEQIVYKELGPEVKQVRGISGGTILGDGNVALVLDISSIIKRDRINSTVKAA